MNVKYKILGSAGLIVAAFILTSIAFVQGATTGSDTTMPKDTTKPSSAMMMHPPKPMILVVNSNGHGLMRGVVESLTVNSLMVAGWGGSWTVNVGSDTKLIPSSLSDVKVGDFVGVIGMVSEDNLTITADRIRDWTAKRMMKGSQ